MAASSSYTPTGQSRDPVADAPQGQQPKGHRRKDHVPRHVREEHRVARTAAAGAAGAVVIGAAFGLTSGAMAGEDEEPPVTAATDRSLDAALDARAESLQGTVSRGLARAPSTEVDGTVARGRAPGVHDPAPQTQTEPPPPPGDVPEECEEYSGNREIGCALLSEFGFGLDEMPALDTLWDHESGWDHTASNPSSGAYGIPQALPGSKMSSVADDWETNPATQIRWGLGYISDRYGSPSEAWAFWQANGWY